MHASGCLASSLIYMNPANLAEVEYNPRRSNPWRISPDAPLDELAAAWGGNAARIFGLRAR